MLTNSSRLGSCAAVLLLCSAAHTQQTHRYDFGPPSGGRIELPAKYRGSSLAQYLASLYYDGRVEAGWIGIHQWSDYEASRGYGWAESKSSAPYDRDTPVSPLFHRRGDYPLYHMLSDGLVFGPQRERCFRVDLEPGTYNITLYLGDLSLGEGRWGMRVMAKDEVLIESVATRGGQVRAVARRLELTESPLMLTFTNEPKAGPQCSVSGFEVRSSSKDAPLRSDVLFGGERFGPEEARLSFEMLMKGERQRWEEAKQALARDDHLGSADLPPANKDATQIYPTTYGDFGRLCNLAPGLDVSALPKLLKEIGVDAVSVSHPNVATQYAAAGIRVIPGVGGERWPSKETPDMQTLLDARGKIYARPGVFSIHSPHNQAEFRKYYLRRLGPVLPHLSAVFVDEPRGMTSAGGIGDYSEWSEAAFRAWCADNAHPECAARGLPKPAMSKAFYAFHLFRFDSVPMFLEGIIRGTPLARAYFMPGNGILGPQYVNHSTFWPPALARAGMMSLSWNYGEPWKAKMSAEVVKATSEFGGKGGVFTLIGHDEARARMQAVAALGAKIAVLSPRSHMSFRLLREFAVLARTLGPAERHCGVYLYWPASLTFPDLVGFSNAEAARWLGLAEALYKANVDYRVTYTGKVMTQPSLLVYAPIKPVLSQREVGDLRAYLAAGGRLVYGCKSDPIRPTGEPYGTLEATFGHEAANRVLRPRSPLTPDLIRAAAAQHLVPSNPQPTSDSFVLTYAFELGDRRLLLVANPDGPRAATLGLGENWRDYFTGQKVSQGSSISVSPGLFRLLVSPSET